VRLDTIDDKGRPVFPKTFVIHSLRHTFGTRLGESGANPYQIMKLMGHSSLQVSQKYVHPTAGGLELAMKGLERMNRMVGGNSAEVPTVFTTVTHKGKTSPVGD
jgi:integrase